MRIAFDATAMLSENGKKTGLDKVAYDYIEEIMECNPANEYFCLNLFNGVIERDWENKKYTFNEIDIYSGESIEILRMPKYEKILERIIRSFLWENKIDVFIFTNPLNFDLTVYKSEWFTRVYTIAMVYDDLPIGREDQFFLSRGIQRKYQACIDVIKNASAMLTASSETREKYIHYVGVSKDKIHIEWQDEIIMRDEEKQEDKDIKKLALFTPLPPIQSGIADYIVPLIEEFSKIFDIDIFIDNGYTPICDLPTNIAIYRHYEFCEKKDRYDEILYEVGCSSYHAYMFDYIKEFPGVIDLHDSNLYPLLYSRTKIFEKQGLGKRFSKHLQDLVEDLSEEEANRLACCRLMNITSGRSDENIINGFLVNYAKKVIVHNEYSRKILLAKDLGRNIDVIPHFSYIKERVMKPWGDNIIAVFGHIATTKRPIPIVKAYRKLLMDGYNAKLLFIGQAHNNIDNKIMAFNQDQAINGRIQILGYVNEDKFNHYMEIADVVVNLRYPYHGESSGALARAFGMGKCVVVNNIGAFAELPDETCIKVPNVEMMSPIEEIEQIYEALKKALDEKTNTKLKEQAYDYAIRELNISITAERYICSLYQNRYLSVTTEEVRDFLRNDKSFGGWD